MLLSAAAYLALASPRAWRRPGAMVTASALAAAALRAPPLRQVDMPEGGHIVSWREGAMAAVSVVEDAAGVSRLRIDNRQQDGSSDSLLADARLALLPLPLLLHPAPQRALFLGLGTGVTATSAALDPSLQVDAAELLPEVIAASAHFTRPLTADSAGPRLHPVAADARRFVRAGGQPCDVIVSDNFHPARSGSGALDTVEHFQAVRGRLGAQGNFCQWLPLQQLDLAMLRSIVRSFQVAVPGGWALLASHSLDTSVLGLLARADGSRLQLPQLRQRLARNTLPQRLAGFGIADDSALLGGFVAGPAALTRFAGAAPLNTDDHPVVAYAAPRITYAPDSLPRDRLLALLGLLGLALDELLAPGGDAAQAGRPPTGRPAISSSPPAGRCGQAPTCGQCWPRCRCRCWACCAPARTSDPSTTPCCAWPRPWRAKIRPVPAACCKTWPACSRPGPRPPRPCCRSARPASGPGQRGENAAPP